MKVVEVGCSVGGDIARPGKEFLDAIGGDGAARKYELPYRARLGGDDGRIACSDSKSLLNFRHRLLGGTAGELLRPGLGCVVARGSLLRTGTGEKRGDDRGQQHNHEQRENERRGVVYVFWQIAFQNIKG